MTTAVACGAASGLCSGAPLSAGLPARVAGAHAYVVNPQVIPASLAAIASDAALAVYDLAGIEGRHAQATVIAWRPRGAGAEEAIEQALSRAFPSARAAGGMRAGGEEFALWRFRARGPLPGGMVAVARLENGVVVSVNATGAVSNRGVLRKAIRAIAGSGRRATVPVATAASAPSTTLPAGQAQRVDPAQLGRCGSFMNYVPMAGFPDANQCSVEVQDILTNGVGVPVWVSCATNQGPATGNWYTWAPNGNWDWTMTLANGWGREGRRVMQANADAWGSHFTAWGDEPTRSLVYIACSPTRRPGS